MTKRKRVTEGQSELEVLTERKRATEGQREEVRDGREGERGT